MRVLRASTRYHAAMVCSNCARIIRTTGRVPPHFANTSANRQTCPEPGGGKYAENIRKQRLAELPGKYRETKRKLEEANNTILDVQKELERERKRVRIPENSACPICLETIKECEDTDSVGFMTLKCGHLVCAPCYNTMVWHSLQDNGMGARGRSHYPSPLRCPICRTNILRFG